MEAEFMVVKEGKGIKYRRESWMARLIMHLLVCVCGAEEQR